MAQWICESQCSFSVGAGQAHSTNKHMVAIWSVSEPPLKVWDDQGNGCPNSHSARCSQPSYLECVMQLGARGQRLFRGRIECFGRHPIGGVLGQPHARMTSDPLAIRGGLQVPAVQCACAVGLGSAATTSLRTGVSSGRLRLHTAFTGCAYDRPSAPPRRSSRNAPASRAASRTSRPSCPGYACRMPSKPTRACRLPAVCQ